MQMQTICVRCRLAWRFALLLQLVSGVNTSVDEFSLADSSWPGDEDLAQQLEKRGIPLTRCDFEHVPAANLTREAFISMVQARRPFIVENFIDDWPAHKLWSKQFIDEKYGDLKADNAETASIKTFGLGLVDKTRKSITSLHEYLESLRTRSDIDFLFGDIPLAMLEDAGNPEMFDFVGLFGSQKDVMVSIAPSRVGFPLHTHGRSWMGLVRGYKLWGVYGPESVPARVYAELTAKPLHWDWFVHTWDSMPEAEQPSVCVQKPTEIFVLPDYWYHMTLNIGEAVGYGAQQNIISPDEAKKLWWAWPSNGRASFELAQLIESGAVDALSLRLPTAATSASEVRGMLLKTAAQGDPLELPFTMQLVQWLYQTNHQSAAQRSLRRTKKLMKELVEKGFAQSDRVATAVMTIGIMLTNAQADNKMARQFLQLADQLAPGTPATLVHLAQHAAEGGDYVKATRLCEQVLKKEPSNPVALGLQQKLQQVQGREL